MHLQGAQAILRRHGPIEAETSLRELPLVAARELQATATYLHTGDKEGQGCIYDLSGRYPWILLASFGLTDTLYGCLAASADGKHTTGLHSSCDRFGFSCACDGISDLVGERRRLTVRYGAVRCGTASVDVRRGNGMLKHAP